MPPTSRYIRIAVIALFLGTGTTSAQAQDVDACIAASEKALSLHDAGKLLETRAALSVCAAATCPDPVRSSCQQRLDATKKSIPTVVFQVKDGAGNDVSGVKISVDGQPSGDSGLTTAMELDPGEHVFRFEANLLPTTEKKLVLVEGAQGRRELIVLGNVSAPALATSPSNSKRTIGIVAGAVGLVGIGVGTFFGLHAISQKNDADAHCVGSVCDTSAARDLENDAKTSAALSTIGFAVGIVGLGVGAYFFVSSLSSPKPAQASASYAKGLVLGRNGIGMGAQW